MDVDVAVLGGGPAGYTAAIRATQLGAKVACVEKEPELGGTCLRVGCIPTKAWVQTAFALREAHESFAKFGVDVGEPQLDFAASNAWKAGVVKQMTTGVAGLFKANGVDWVKGAGTFTSASTIAVEVGDDGSQLRVTFGDGETVEADLMLVSVGRAPLVEGLGLEQAGVEFDKRKGIAADEHRRTTAQNIYAVGDCAGYWQLAHTAFREGEVAAENAAGHHAIVDNRAVPRPIYTDPEIAGVGLTEAEAREQYGADIATGMFPWVANARAVMQNETVGWVKSIHETRYGELLGLVMVGPHVTDLVEAGVVAIDAEATVETVADGMTAHPTLSEAIKEAGLVALGRAIHVPNRKRAKAPA